jgi:hypothetical protein
MATYSPSAFDQFRSQQVDLDSDEVKKARASRDYLQQQITELPKRDSNFPRLWSTFESFGSFARRTKVRPLDDIDFMPLLDGLGTTEWFLSDYSYRISLSGDNHPLKPYADNGYLNSTKILNKFKSSLQNVPTYKQSELKRNGEAVVLNLVSYAWSFDLVPALPIGDGQGGVSRYLVPDGSGNWKRSDPRRDQTTVSNVNKRHNSNALPLIRLIKYWNVHSNAAPRLPSYYLEAMLLAGLSYEAPVSSVRRAIPLAFRLLESRVSGTLADPNGFGPNLDIDVPWSDQQKVKDAAKDRAQWADYALMYEDGGDHKNAFYWWGRVFPNFPPYG